MERGLAEKIAAILALHPAPDKTAGSYSADESHSYEARALSAHDIDLRALSAWAIVTPSAYSRSPPTGSPRAMRETVRG
jgi:hypothetical protein